MREFGEVVNEKYRHVPKFLPTPKLDEWKGENIYRFQQSIGPMYSHPSTQYPKDLVISFVCVMHAQMQLAGYMGFTTMLIVGMDHTIEEKAHFWGVDEEMPGTPNVQLLEKGYKVLREGLEVAMWNISTRTNLSEEIIPRKDWREFLLL
jgi:hypothetical protein